MENESSIKEIIRNSLDQVRTIVDADTIIGKQIVTPSGVVIIPISKVSMGFASGGLDLPAKEKNDGAKKEFRWRRRDRRNRFSCRISDGNARRLG